MAIIRVRIPAITVDVDAEAWDREYGCGARGAEIREDVRNYFDLANIMPDHLVEIVRVKK